MFEQKKYYKQSKILENISIIVFIIYCSLITAIGTFFFQIKGLIIGVILGIITGYIPYLKSQIKVQEMRMMLEIHNNTTNKES